MIESVLAHSGLILIFLFRGEKMADKRYNLVFDAKLEIGQIK